MKELGKNFPAGLEWAIPYDTSKYVRVSIEEVAKTLVEDHRLDEGLRYLFDRDANVLAGVVGDGPFEACREVLPKLLHTRLDTLRHVECIGARRELDRRANGVTTFARNTEGVVAGAKLDASHVAQPDDFALGTCLEDDAFELLGIGESALRRHAERHVHVLDYRLV